MPSINLTDSAIERLPTPTTGTVFYIDAKNKKFQLAVGKRKRTFYAIAYLNGHNVRKKLGEWPYVKARAARSFADEFLGDISRGIDPRRTKAGTLEEVLNRYIESRMHASRNTLSENTASQYRRALNNHCHRWMDRDVTSITLEDVKALHHRLRDKPYMANQIVRAIRALFADAGHSMKFPKGFFYPERARENRIDDLSEFFARVEQIDNPSRRAFWYLGCYTGIRRDTVLSLRWEQIDLDAGTVHLPKMKNGLARTLPLSKQAVQVCVAQQGLSDEWLLPSLKGNGHLVEARDDVLQKIRPHDTRRVFTEACGSILLPDYAVDYLRGDTMKTTTHKYMTRLNVETLRDPAQRVADYLDAFKRVE